MDSNITAALIGLIGVIVGAIATSLLALGLEYLKSKKEEALYLKRRQEEVYLDCIKCLGQLNNEMVKTQLTVEYATSLNASLNLYGSTELSSRFKCILDNLLRITPIKQDAEIKEFIKDVRILLGIKD